ncbi:MAG: peptidoglycan DD-metalloendopeptidase family protein [Deltaproteobacteria bacterium]|nr:peptidoglycan DD-metalloendopeptidase family protein [Deltaproteobacteria bacterium]
MLKKIRDTLKRGRNYCKAPAITLQQPIFRLSLGIVGVAIFYSLAMTWGFFHYRTQYTELSSSAVLTSASHFEREKAKLVAKIGGLEDALQRTEHFTQKLEAAVGVESNKLNKGVGPLSEQEDLAEFLKRVHQLPKVGSTALKQDWQEGKFDTEFYAKLNVKIDEMAEFASRLEERINEVYTASQEKISFWSTTPSHWPVQGWVTSEFGMRYNPFGGYRFHEGLDIAAPVGTSILAPSDGIIIMSKYDSGYGNSVIIDHGYGVTTRYAHASALFVTEGDRVMRGQKIAAVGSTGSSTGPHLHYEVKVDGISTNPMNYIFE